MIRLDEVMVEIKRKVEKRKEDMLSQYAFAKIEEFKKIAYPDYATFSPAARIGMKGTYQIGELLHYNDEDFVRNAYSAILGRDPDPTGLQGFLSALRKGVTSKVEIIWEIRHSEEGKSRNVGVLHLSRHYYLNRLKRLLKDKIPLVRYAVKWLLAIIRLPKIVRLVESIDRELHAFKHTNNKIIQSLLSDLTDQVNSRLADGHSASLEERRISRRNALNISRLSEVVHTDLKNRLVELDQVVHTDLESRLGKLDRDVHADMESRLGELNRLIYADIESRLSEQHQVIYADMENRLRELDRLMHTDIECGLIEVRQKTEEFQQLLHKQKVMLLDQERRLALLLEEARKRLPEPITRDQIEEMAREEDHLLDAMYVSFEDIFRGTRLDIKKRLEVYLPYVSEVSKKIKNAAVLDIGCGRGEWLELLKENSYAAQGVDLNRVMVKQCRDIDLDVVDRDGIDYLATKKKNSLAVITGFHIIEHIPLKRLISLLDESLRALKPGGMIIFETPNPENLLVGSCTFYTDPTHRSPLVPDAIKFLVEHRGFMNIKILRLHPLKKESLVGNPPIDEIISRYNMEQDFAVIGYKG